ncbi:MAG: hypothetical protein R8M45_05210, partial [Ghiorsea sp.]
VASNHTDGGIDINVEAAIALCKWKMENYIAMIAGRIAAAAPLLIVGDAVWSNPRFAPYIPPLLPTAANAAFPALLNTLTDAYGIAHDPNSTGYTQIKDQDLDQNGTVAINIASKLFVGVGDRVRFCQTGDPTRWFYDAADKKLDTGWLPVGNQLSGSREVTGLGQHLGKLAVFFDDASQIWAVDPDPQLMAFQQVIKGVGTAYPRSIDNVGNDVTFLHRTGFRSIAAMQYNNNLTDTDSGSAIDKLITAFIDSTVLRQDADVLAPIAHEYKTINKTNIISKTLSTLGQYWCAVGKDVFVLTFSKAAQITGWSRYTLPFEVDDIAEMKGTVYIRARTSLYAYDALQLRDDVADLNTADPTAPIEGKAVLHFLNAKAAGRMKMFHSMDATINGEADISFLYDAGSPLAETLAIPLSGDSNPSFLTPMHVSSTHIAPVITSLKHFELEYLALYYNLLGRR